MARYAWAATFRLAVLILPGLALAGPGPMPLEAQLDLAETVVLGKIVKLEPLDEGHGVRWGRATVAVEEVLKGAQAKEVSFKVAVWVVPDYGGSSPPHVHKLGDEGIWVVLPHEYGLLRREQLKQVRAILADLAARKWSEPVNGLRAWAAVVKPGYTRQAVVVFAVQNVSDKAIFCPSESRPETVKMVVEDTGHGPQVCPLYGDRKEDPKARVWCLSLKSQEVAYLHPGYTCLPLPEGLPAGQYTVRVTLQNERDGEGKDQDKPEFPRRVEAWKGFLNAPPVRLTVEEPPVQRKASP